MGGAYGPGNVTQTTEFNIFVDPEAAAIVFGAPWSVTMVGLDVTHQAGCGADVQKRIEDLGSPVGAFVGDLLRFYRGAYQCQTGLTGPLIHDAYAVAYALAPENFETRAAAVDVELAGSWTSGTTLVHFVREGDRVVAARGHDFETRHRVPVHIDSGALFELMVDALSRLS